MWRPKTLSKLRRIGLPLALTLAALAVRLFNLSYHSLWFDEAMSVHWARSSLPRILEVSMNLVEDRLPPLYYLVLHYWRLLAGDGEVAVRLPSVLMGTLLVPLVYRLGRRSVRGPTRCPPGVGLDCAQPFPGMVFTGSTYVCSGCVAGYVRHLAVCERRIGVLRPQQPP